MKIISVIAVSLVLVGLTACQNTEVQHTSGAQAIEVDGQKTLLIWVEGIKTRTRTADSGSQNAFVQRATKGETIHRVLESNNGEILFAYDLQVKRGLTDGSYRFLLKPAQTEPTFKSSRDVLVNSHEDTVKVDLMAQPNTGQKIVDVFRLVDRNVRNEHQDPIHAHLVQFHAWLAHTFHGQ